MQVVLSDDSFDVKIILVFNSQRFSKRVFVKRKIPTIADGIPFVTPKVEKSNFYKDLNTLIDSEFTTKKILEKKK
jgi:hypothetical protein